MKIICRYCGRRFKDHIGVLKQRCMGKFREVDLAVGWDKWVKKFTESLLKTLYY